MVNITHKSFTLRQATAQASVRVSLPETIRAIEERRVPKGDVIEFCRAAGLLAIKKTADVIPDCHPLPVEYAGISCSVDGLCLVIRVEVHTIYKTGVEVEAMHGAAVAALTMYDMLKPIDPGIRIENIVLEEKRGGKGDFKDLATSDLSCAVIVCSDSVSAGTKQDTAGATVADLCGQYHIPVRYRHIIPDDPAQIQAAAREAQANGIQLLLFTGGTGLSPRDVTPDAIRPLLDRDIPGVMEAARSYGQQRTPYAMLSRGIAGFMGDMLVVTLPGSTKGARETMQALFPHLLHVFRMAAGKRHD